VLPVFYTDNYISLAPKEEKTVTIEAALADLKGEKPLVLVDGWNIAVTPATAEAADIALNDNAQVSNSPQDGLPFFAPPVVAQDKVHMNAGGFTRDGYQGDPGYLEGTPGFTTDPIVMKGTHLAPMSIYQTVRWGSATYPFELTGGPDQTYTVRLHFAELNEKEAGKRVFNVFINGKEVLTDFDVFKEAGGRYKALVKEFAEIAPDEKKRITIEVKTGKTGTPQINGIEIVPDKK
jgi:hypothetical protein